MQGTQVQTLTLELSSHMPRANYARALQLRKPRYPRVRAPQREKPEQGEAGAPQPERSRHSVKLESAHLQQRRPSAAKK